jgi:hypothetical protein
MLVVGTIADMGVDKYIRIPIPEYLGERFCIFRITFDEVPVQIEVTCVSAKALVDWAILIGTRAASAV